MGLQPLFSLLNGTALVILLSLCVCDISALVRLCVDMCVQEYNVCPYISLNNAVNHIVLHSAVQALHPRKLEYRRSRMTFLLNLCLKDSEGKEQEQRRWKTGGWRDLRCERRETRRSRESS